MKTRKAMLFAVALLSAAFAAAQSQPASFQKPSADSLKELKRTVGKPFNAGVVFIEGKYIKPPYKVERYGTVIRINDIQATGEIIPWVEFIKTQDGVQTSRTESEVPSSPEPEPEPAVEEDEDDFDLDSSLDDLFDDDPKPKKKPAKKKRPAARPRPRKPTVTVSYSFDGVFVHNDKTRMYLEKINLARTRIDQRLRAGGCIFFGPKYKTCFIEIGPTKMLMAKLPEIMKNNPTKTQFESAVRMAGLTYLPNACISELFRYRFDYPQLMERRKTMDDKERWSGLMSR